MESHDQRDLIQSHDPSDKFTAQHRVKMNGKRDGFTWEDFKVYGRVTGLKQDRADHLLQEIGSVLKRWSAYAQEVGVRIRLKDGIWPGLRTDLLTA